MLFQNINSMKDKIGKYTCFREKI